MDVVSNFDIDVCSPIIVIDEAVLWVQMSRDIASGIQNRTMHCTVRKRTSRFMQYPFQRTLHRLRKYVSRGYTLQSLKFESAVLSDSPDRDAPNGLSVDDFDCWSFHQNRGLPHAHLAVCSSESLPDEQASDLDSGFNDSD